MISNERPAPFGNRPYDGGNRKPSVTEDLLRAEIIQVERKSFKFSLKENPRGRFLRITEDVGGRYDSIVIPATGLEEFRRVLDEMTIAASEIPQSQSQKSG
jgi:hypothetical protein